MIDLNPPLIQSRLYRAWWLRPTTVSRYEHQDSQWVGWDSRGLFRKYDNVLWSFPYPEPRESFFQWLQHWAVRRTPLLALPPSSYKPRFERISGPNREGWEAKKMSPFEKAKMFRQWDWELRVRHIFDVPKDKQ